VSTPTIPAPALVLRSVQATEAAIASGIDRCADALDQIGTKIDTALARLRLSAAGAMARLTDRAQTGCDVLAGLLAFCEHVEAACWPEETAPTTSDEVPGFGMPTLDGPPETPTVPSDPATAQVEDEVSALAEARGENQAFLDWQFATADSDVSEPGAERSMQRVTESVKHVDSVLSAANPAAALAPQAITVPALDRKYGRKSKADLIYLCHVRGLDDQGSKAQLCNRLREHDSAKGGR
jgi:hypothetical protein